MTGQRFDKKWQKTVAEGAAAFDIKLDQAQIDLLTCHATELIKWNKKFNITAIVDPHEVAVKHFIDSLAICRYIPDGARVIDLGSGGGFPGIPLKIAKPSVDLVMVDASRKKVSFLKQMIRTVLSGIAAEDSSTLKKPGMEALHVRGEQLGKEDGYARSFDVVISRAFTSLSGFFEMALPFLNDTGYILAMKGDLTSEELALLDDKSFDGGCIEIMKEVIPYTLPFENYRRCVVKGRVHQT